MLSPDERRRYVRHILLPEIGLDGQERLCASRAWVPEGADARARAVAEDYLRRAGVTMGEPTDGAELPLATALEVEALAGGDPRLRDAAAAVAGAFAAVEVIKGALSVGRRGSLPSALRSARRSET